MSAMIPEPNTVPPAAPAEGQLTEEDLIEMREQSSGQGNNAGGSETADESIISLADSSSNFDERAGDDFDEVGTADEPDDNYAEQIYNGWAFGRARTPNPILPKDTVQVLTWPMNKSVPVCPEWCNQADWKDAVTAAKVYLIGTAHFSKESQEDVIETIRAVQPDIVMVELCPSRISILSMDESTLLKEAKELSMEKMRNIIKQSGMVQGILHVMLLSMSAHITRQLSMAPGGEFRAAHRAVMQTQLCRLVLGDRPIHITLQRALAALTVWQKVKFFFHVCCSHFNTITPEDVERCKRQDLLEELLAEMAGDFPKLSEIFVRERDQYMVFSLQHTLASNTAQKYRSWRQFREEEEGSQVEWQPLRIVAVVGIGHTPGIVANWQSEINIGELIRVPPASRAGQILKYTVRAAIYGAAGYLLYKGAGRVARNFVKL